MATLKEDALAYEAPQIKNIADLEVVPVDLKTEEREFTDNEGKKFSIKVIIRDNEEYRVPTSVIKALKEILAEKPDLRFFKVKKSGEGLKTSYTVIPVE